MPYLSHNYRYQPKSRLKNMTEAAIFVATATVAIFAVLLFLGWFSSTRAAAVISQQTESVSSTDIIQP